MDDEKASFKLMQQFKHLQKKLSVIAFSVVNESPQQAWFTDLLSLLLDLSHSNVGFIGLFNKTADQPYLRFVAMHDRNWSQQQIKNVYKL